MSILCSMFVVLINTNSVTFLVIMSALCDSISIFRIVEVLEPYKRQTVFILERQVNSFMKVVLIGRLKLSSTDIFYNVHAYLFSLFLILARPAIMKALDSICV